MQKRTFYLIFIIVGVLFWATFQCLIFITPGLIEKAINSTERVVFVENTDLASMPGIEILDANNIYFRVVEREPNRIDIHWKNETKINTDESKCLLEKLDYQIVSVTAGFNNKDYPIIIDTGYDNYIKINDVVIIENNLKIFPFETDEPTLAGFSYIDEIQIDDMKITNIPTSYNNGHYEKQILGKTKWKQSKIIMGLRLMRRFQYILIDNVASQVEFSLLESFQADSNDLWRSYKMSIEKDKQNLDMERAVIEIPISGDNTMVMLDTGAGGGLLMSQDKWKIFSKNLNVIKEENALAQMVYGWEDIKKFTVEELTIGHKTISNASIEITSNQSRYESDYFLLGMLFFKDTAIVLDFENNLFWIRESVDSLDDTEEDS